MAKKEQLQYNRNGIPINRHLSMALLRVMGADDPFEGKNFDPQFEAVRDAELGKIERGKGR